MNRNTTPWSTVRLVFHILLYRRSSILQSLIPRFVSELIEYTRGAYIQFDWRLQNSLFFFSFVSLNDLPKAWTELSDDCFFCIQSGWYWYQNKQWFHMAGSDLSSRIATQFSGHQSQSSNSSPWSLRASIVQWDLSQKQISGSNLFLNWLLKQYN